ncbi:transcription antitermination factor NusB [Microgenomates group bacterium RIFCSPLOWO2_01_FULL_46_13]|nr:MAG: transcription antitermination factor NusB [Microgenomates group bacterium RIFCSPHIGHO2_01_FULL_45_11]OGV94781.1 MAG: transcription antitermination factor NusB [Microgenomates group bacterium RIFCSPLOWO2_01_FULL_46_13]
MKQAADPRHQKRIRLVKDLFAYSFSHGLKPTSTIKTLLENQEEIDRYIQAAAPEWPLTQINRVDLSILRLAVHELLLRKVPRKVVIDEAVELAKAFGSEASPKFVNGVLGTVVERLTVTTFG